MGGSTTPSADLEHRRLKSAVRQALFGRRDPIRIGRFTVLRRLGSGGMGIVYSAYDDELDRKVAIKLVREDRATGVSARDRLRREAQAAAKLSHPNVVSVFEVGTHEESLYVAMEFVRGATVREWLAEAPRDWPKIRAVFVQAGEGLAAAHEAGLVHRDFKPDNVMVGPNEERVIVLDFGLAAIDPEASGAVQTTDEGVASTRLTITGERLGTPAYMAPEQHAGEEVDARADQYAFCLSLWEALHGSRPFAREDGSIDIEAMHGDRVPEPSARVPASVRGVLVRGLARDPARRFPSMRHLLAELRRDPARRWKRVGLGTAAALLVGAAAGVGYLEAAEPTCVPASRRVASVWSPARQTEIRGGVAEADPELSLQRWGEAVARVDDHLARWTAVYEQTCDALRSADEQEPLLQRRLCLERDLDEVDRVLSTLASGDREAVAALDGTLDGLAPPEACADENAVRERAHREALRSAPPPPGLEPGVLISDFEDGMRARIGFGWQWSTDTLAGGSSTVELAVADSGEPGGHALRITGEVKPNPGNPVWSGALYFPGSSPMVPVNFSHLDAVTFRARGRPGRYYVLLFRQRKLFDPAAVVIDVDESWNAYRVPFDALERDRFDVTGVFFGAADNPGPYELFVDDVAFE